MSPLCLTVDAIAGSDFHEVASSAIFLSRRLEIMVTFNFNGFDCNVTPKSNANSLHDSYVLWRETFDHDLTPS